MQNAGRFDSGTEIPDPRTATGCEGLDRIMEGGFPSRRLYLIEGSPGTGKTTLALQFLLEGVRNGEPVLYVTLSETKEELTEVAPPRGLTLVCIDICRLTRAKDSLNTAPH